MAVATISYAVVTFYASLVLWLGTLVSGLRKTTGFGPFFIVGLCIMLSLNLRYVFEGAAGGLTLIVSIYDVVANIGLKEGDELPVTMSTCEGNHCTLWGDTYKAHSEWTVVLYERFLKGPEMSRKLLYGHLVLNTVAMVLMHLQMFRPGGRKGGEWHAVIGRIWFVCLTISIACACALATEHVSVKEYGGQVSTWGFYSMSATVWIPAALAVREIRNGNVSNHRVWMFRHAGAIWGAFYGFRLAMLVIEPLLRNYQLAAWLIATYFSAPVGFLGGEIIRRRLDHGAKMGKAK